MQFLDSFNHCCADKTTPGHVKPSFQALVHDRRPTPTVSSPRDVTVCAPTGEMTSRFQRDAEWVRANDPTWIGQW
jgi:hypothetical protein